MKSARGPNPGLRSAGRLAAVLLAACGAVGCAQSDAARPVGHPAEHDRDVAALAGRAEKASILDVDLFQPQARIGSNCRGQPLPSASDPPSAPLREALEQAAAYSASHRGVGLLVLKDGALVFERYDVASARGAPTNSFSMHKSVLAMLYGLAIADGVIGSLDDPVGRYIGEWAGDPRGRITLRQLLTMSSGLKFYTFSDPESKSARLAYASDIDAVALEFPLDRPPGAEFVYQNANSQIAGIALDRALKASGRGGYIAYLDKRLWCPVGNGPAHVWIDRPGGSPHYPAGLFAQMEDWARLGELVRTGGRAGSRQVLPRGWVDEMVRPAATNSNYGLHLWLGAPADGKRRYSARTPLAITHSAPYRADDVVFFDGFGGQRVYVVPSAGLTIVRTGEIDLAYDDAIIVNLLLTATDPN